MKKIVLLIIFMCLSACATLRPNFQTPEIKVANITPSANSGLEQSFDILLRVTNPNAKALDLVGMTYKIQLDGFNVISGVANDIPSIAGYGEELVKVKASIGLIEGVKFLGSLMSKSNSNLKYKISAKLDTGILLLGNIPVSNSGEINLSDLQSKK